LTLGGGAGTTGVVQRLELTRIHACERCGRGRAELATGEGDVLVVGLDAAAVQELREGREGGEVPWLSSLLLELLGARRDALREVVLDAGPKGLRALLTLSHGDTTDVIACAAQEGIALAVRGALPLYATAEALEAGGRRERSRGGERLH
jgi:hypothetical protein